MMHWNSGNAKKTMEKLAKTRGFSAPYILVSVLVVFNLLNAKAVVVAVITETQTWCQRSHLLVKLSTCFWCYCKRHGLQGKAPCSSVLSKHRWLSGVITKAWQSCTMWMLDWFGSFDIGRRRRLEQEKSIMCVGRVVMKKLRSGRLCVYAKVETGKTVFSRWLRFMGQADWLLTVFPVHCEKLRDHLTSSLKWCDRKWKDCVSGA